ncbi:Nitroreductase [Meira miltonrushii]|uniref:Nitroreductase n=1 Tax=Meira miltonrushii TaxID=1280837 RepID=A0A316VAW9_9BASI|nr:Nitroreductase [Meira miltonrushii]PWN34789.1 Nitroreductase [Meira miltonrushii]
MLTSIKKAFSATPSKPTSQSQPQTAPEKPAVTMSKSQKVQEFLQLIKQRRSIHALNNTPILPDAELVSLIKSTVRESPSAFNSQTSRVVVLLGEDHVHYWSNIVKPAMRKAITDEATWSIFGPRYDMFAQGYGTALFFEDERTIKQLQESRPAIAKLFPQWSTHASGMAQLNTWTALEVAGYGANLQHVSESCKKHVDEQKTDIPLFHL